MYMESKEGTRTDLPYQVKTLVGHRHRSLENSVTDRIGGPF